MKQNTKTAKMTTETVGEEITLTNVTQDLKNSVLIVSVVVNLFVFTAWTMLQVTHQFDAQFANLLFNH